MTDIRSNKVLLAEQGHEFVGAAIARIGRFVASRPMRLRAVVTAHPQERLAVVLTLESPLSESARQFVGTLRRPVAA